MLSQVVPGPRRERTVTDRCGTESIGCGPGSQCTVLWVVRTQGRGLKVVDARLSRRPPPSPRGLGSSSLGCRSLSRRRDLFRDGGCPHSPYLLLPLLLPPSCLVSPVSTPSVSPPTRAFSPSTRIFHPGLQIKWISGPDRPTGLWDSE